MKQACLLGEIHGALASRLRHALEEDGFAAAATRPDALVLLADSASGSSLLSLEEDCPSDGWAVQWQRGRPLVKAMEEEGRGAIVLVTSSGALLGQVRSLALQLAPRQVTVNAIALNEPLSPQATDAAVHLTRYLCSEEASYVTGQIFPVGER